MHVLERTLEDTIGYLSSLERSSASLQEALDRSNQGAASEQLPPRERSSNDASTSQVGQFTNITHATSWVR